MTAYVHYVINNNFDITISDYLICYWSPLRLHNLTEEQLMKQGYEPHLYYYWHGDIQEDYQMPAGYDCLCECCFGSLLDTGHIITTDDSTWNPDTMGWFVPVDKVSTTAGNVPQLPL